MSFDVYLQDFRSGEPAGIPRDLVRQAFGTVLSEVGADHWTLSFGPTSSCDLYLSALGNDPRYVHNITVERPCRDLRLWDGLAYLLAVEGSVLYFPDAAAPLASSAVVGHLPSDMLDALGQPILVKTGHDILRSIETD